MSTRPKQAEVDPVQLFCANFPSPTDMSDGTSKNLVKKIRWPELEGVSHTDLVSARISRRTLEVIQLILDDPSHPLATEAGPYYISRKPEQIVDANSVVLALTRCNPPLANPADFDSLVEETRIRVVEWHGLLRDKLRKIP